MADEVLVERLDDGAIGVVTLNRPERHNALNRAMSQQFVSVMRALGEDRATRVIIVRGAGERAFSAGADLTEMGATHNAPAPPAAGGSVGAALNVPAEVEQPVIAMVHGYCIGGGCELALACDLRIADERARFGIPAAKLGVVLGVAEVQRLRDVVGTAAAKEMLFTGRLLDAAEARALGLVNQVVPAENLHDTVLALARQMTANAPTAIATVKALLNGLGENMPLESLTARRDIFAARASRNREREEGIRAFRERRQPNFTSEEGSS